VFLQLEIIVRCWHDRGLKTAECRPSVSHNILPAPFWSVQCCFASWHQLPGIPSPVTKSSFCCHQFTTFKAHLKTNCSLLQSAYDTDTRSNIFFCRWRLRFELSTYTSPPINVCLGRRRLHVPAQLPCFQRYWIQTAMGWRLLSTLPNAEPCRQQPCRVAPDSIRLPVCCQLFWSQGPYCYWVNFCKQRSTAGRWCMCCVGILTASTWANWTLHTGFSITSTARKQLTVLLLWWYTLENLVQESCTSFSGTRFLSVVSCSYNR